MLKYSNIVILRAECAEKKCNFSYFCPTNPKHGSTPLLWPSDSNSNFGRFAQLKCTVVGVRYTVRWSHMWAERASCFDKTCNVHVDQR